MKKIVINTCWGGFGLSDEAFERILKRRGIAFESCESNYPTLFGLDYYHAGHVGDEDHYISQYDLTENRADVDLVAVVEELGQRANGMNAELKIVIIPDDVEWHIGEYDGLEHVAENHRTWYE